MRELVGSAIRELEGTAMRKGTKRERKTRREDGLRCGNELENARSETKNARREVTKIGAKPDEEPKEGNVT